MGRSMRRTLAALVIGGGVVLVSATTAGADVIDPPGACNASGTWTGEGVTRSSGDFEPDDVIVIPQEDEVAWEGGVGDAGPDETGPERDISGEVEVDVAGITTLKIDDWDGPSESYGNSDVYEYDVPDALVNVKMKLQGSHSGAAGEACSGSVYLKVEGSTFSNPLAIVFTVLTILFAGGLMAAGVVRKAVV